MKQKLFSIFFALALLLSNVATQAQTSIPQHNLRQIQNVEVANKKSVVQGGNPIIAAKERIAQRQTQLRGNKAMQDYSLLNKVNETQLKARAMAAMAQQTETINVDMGHCNLAKTEGTMREDCWFQASKDNREYAVSVCYNLPSLGWIESTTYNSYDGDYTSLGDYSAGYYYNVTSAKTIVTKISGSNYIFNIYMTVSDNANVYHFTMEYSDLFDYDAGASGSFNFSYTGINTIEYNSDNATVDVLAYTKNSSEIYIPFYTGNTNSTIIPTGNYPINLTRQTGTVEGTGGFTGDEILGCFAAKLIRQNREDDQFEYLFFLEHGYACVINPNNSNNPFIYVWGVSAKGAAGTATIGTEPTHRTVTVGAWEDANGNGLNLNYNTDLLDADYENRIFTFWQGTTLTLEPYHVEGYHFKNWTGTYANEITPNGDGTYSLTIGAKNYTITAVFEEDAAPVDVTLDPNDGSTGNGQVVVATKGQAMPTTLKGGGSIVAPQRTGYVFGGYFANTNGTGTQYYNANLTSANTWDKDVAAIIYAKWTQTVTLNQNGGSANGTITVTYNANTTASFSAVTGVPEGYSALKGYYDAATGGNKIFNADGSLVTGSAVAGLIDASGNWIHTGAAPSIYAQFTPNTNTNYTVKHWQQNLADNDYTEVTGDRQQLQGTTDDATAADANTYTGFTAQSFDQETIAGDGSTVVNIYYNRDTYTVNLAVSPAGYGSVSPSAAITGVRYGTVITTGTGENANKVTINKTVVTANPAATTAEYTYTFDNWINGTATVTGSGLTVTANFTRTKVQYTLAWNMDGGTTTSVAGEYTNGLTDWGTPITAPADPTKAGYTFGGWDADNDDTADNVAATMPTSDVTYKALWNAISSDLVLKDGVTTGQTDINFDEFAATYNGQTMSSVTLNRTFTAGNWATLCLPFDVDESQLSSTGLFRKVYEFRYATGSADVGDQVTFHFRVATSMEAGRGYLVKGTSGMGSSFVFNNVTINTSADTEADVNDLKGVNYYYDESVGSDIVIVGVLRSGTLRADGKKVMGLANNMIWYPHTNGNPMPAYRAYFYNPSASNAIMPRVRIVVEGEGTTELEVVDGELYDANNGFDADGDVRAPSGAARKYIRNGVLIIERNGVRYDAQGKRL